MQQTNNHLFTINCGQGGDTQIQRLLPSHNAGIAVLRQILLGDIQPRHNFQPGNHRSLQFFRHGNNRTQTAVNTHANIHVVLARLKVNIAGLLRAGALNNRVHQPDSRGSIGLCRLLVHSLRSRRANILIAQQITLHILNGAHRPLIAVKVLHCTFHRGLGGNIRQNTPSGNGLNFLNSHKIQRIGHRQMNIGAAGLNWHHHMLFGNIFRQQLRHFRRQVVIVQIYKFHAQLAHQSINQLLFCDKTMILQNLAQAFPRAGLQSQRLFQLRLRNRAAFNQQIANFNIFHLTIPLSKWL